MDNSELDIIVNLTGVTKDKIKFSDDGFLSRGYIIDNGRIVFKFKKFPDVSYKNEIEILNYINSLSLNVNIQKVGWISEDDSYLGLYGIPGVSLEKMNLSSEYCETFGRELATFLKLLHTSKNENLGLFKITDEITAWQDRFEKSKPVLSVYFNESELSKMGSFIYQNIPERLKALGEKYVFSHGDLGLGNIFVNENSNLGVIDFSESMYLDESADFMDIENDELIEKVLDFYGADQNLREKVKLRRDIRPMFVIGTYKNRPEEIMRFVQRIRNWLTQN